MKPGIRLVVALVFLAAMVAAARAEAQSIVMWHCNGGTHPDCDVPPPNKDFIAVAVGNYHTMGLKPDGSIVAWGLCDIEQCWVPAPNSGFLQIAAGDSHSLGLRPGGSASFTAAGNPREGEDYERLVYRTCRKCCNDCFFLRPKPGAASLGGSLQQSSQ